jgi:anti-sigma factor RsiW
VTNCREVLEKLSEYLDEELPPGACDQIARHLSECSDCEESKQRLLRSIEECRRFASGEQPRELPASVREELREAYLRVRAGMQR